MKKYEWFGCPNLSPKGGFMCGKPIGHSGSCAAGFCSGEKISWSQDSTVEKQVPWPITVDDSDVNKFGLKIEDYQKHKDECKKLQQNSWLMFGV